MTDQAEALLDGAVQALQAGEASTCISLSTQALQCLAEGDRRIPEALSLRGTARMGSLQSAAFEDLRKAVALDPAEPQFQTALGQALLSTGQLDEAEVVLAKAFQTSRGHPAVAGVLGRCLLDLGKAFDAVQALGPLVQSGKAGTGVIRLFAEALYESGDIYSARDVLLQLYSESGPQRPEEKLQLARIDMALRDYKSADNLLSGLLETDATSLPALMSSVRLMGWMDNRDRLKAHLFRLEKSAGDRPEALGLIIDHADTVSVETLEKAERLLSGATHFSEELASLGFSLALYHDRQKDFERAFDLAMKTNSALARLRGAEQTEDVREARLERDRARLASAIRLFSRSSPVGAAGTHQSFLYLIGAPRTGSSLIQSVLAAPPDVASVGERGALLPYLQDAAEKAVEAGAFQRLATQLAQADQSGLKRMGVEMKTIVDKTPHHLYVAGLLKRINPVSHFVQVFRDAGDVALSMYLRPFSPFFAEATDLDALADMLEFRLEVYKAWREAGLEIMPFSYEHFTASPEREGERLFSVLGLSWDKGYLDPACRPDAVPTFSSRQVRQRISHRSSPHWHGYQAFAPEAFERLNEITRAQNTIIETFPT